jgi:predicted house-cleaning noncanonical NTP pyrophosphatase (MazG superfamily)
MKFKHNILVRNNRIEQMQAEGCKIKYRILTNEEYIQCLRQKLIEEATEASTEKDINEWGLNTTFNRYQAVNLENEETVELRFCKSTNDYDVFIERLKMICAIVQFSKKYKIENIYNYTKDNFISAFNNVYKELFGMFLFV